MKEQGHISDEDLLRAIDRELPARRHATLEAHLARCVSCSARFSDIRAALDDATQAWASAPAARSPVPAYARARLARALADEATTVSRPWLSRLWAALSPSPAMATLGVAATAVLFVALVAVWRVGTDSSLSAHDSLPVRTLTPGATSGLTAADLCAGSRPSRLVTVASRRQVLRDYQMDGVSEDRYELDALITPELGGTSDPANLWPQRYDLPVWNAAVKDQLERLLAALVCSHQVELSRAQQDIATNWIAAYRKYFKSDVPLPAQTEARGERDDELARD